MKGRTVGVLVVGVLCCSVSCASSRPKAVTAVPGSFRALAALLITDPPAGYRLQPDSIGDTGPSDLAKAIRDDGEADAKQALISEGFVRGYQRMWATAAGGDQIVVFLSQFLSAAGADGSYGRWVSLESPSGSDTTIFTPTGLPKGHSVGLSGSSGGATGAIVLYAVGIFAVQVDVTTSGSEHAARTLANTIAVDQLRRL
jgi:hypothetical protein